jgi:hypothetical protein
MTDTARDETADAMRAADPFVVQVNWLLGAVGGKDELVQRTGKLVSLRTLDNWTSGRYPKNKVTGAVRDVDSWATRNLPGYPEGAGVPRLIECCGPYRATTAESTAELSAPPSPDAPRARPRWQRWPVLAAAIVLVAVIAVVATLLLTQEDDPVALPTGATGPSIPETTGRLGANTFANPVLLQDNAMPIPPHTTVQVRCRYYAPSIPSVTPDGFWYLIDSGKWAGRWTPANSFMNGDVPGQPTLHNTDFAVPVCE